MGTMRAVHDRRSFLRSSSLVVVALAAPGCDSCKKGSTGDRPKVAVSILPLWDLARRIAGDKLDVALVLPAGKTEHAYDPTPKEMQKLSGSKLAISVGLGMDTWLSKVVSGVAAPGYATLELGPKADPMPIGAEAVGEEDHDHDHDGKEDHEAHEHEHEKGAPDPHFWLDPMRAIRVLDPLAEAFEKLAPGGGFKARADDTKKSLEALHSKIEGRAKSWQKKSIVTFHGSFAYYAARYGLTIAAVIEPFPGKEPTAKYLKEVLGSIDKAKPAALFSEPQLDKKPAQVVADQAKIPLFELDPIGAEGDTYESLLNKNTDVLEKALR
jgi:zinc transport system substrate-binding protein